jgi:DNA-binding NarL/FixJ family response regulator
MSVLQSNDLTGNLLENRPVAQAGPRRQPRFGKLREEDAPLVARLSEREQTILRQSGSMKEISARLSVPLGTVKSRLHRARFALAALRDKAEARPEDASTPAS